MTKRGYKLEWRILLYAKLPAAGLILIDQSGVLPKHDSIFLLPGHAQSQAPQNANQYN